MDTKKILFLAGIVVLLSIIGLVITSPTITGNIIKQEAEEVNINYDNFAEVLSYNKIVLDLPKKSRVLLGEYGGDFDHKYLIEKGKISEVNEKPEVDFEVNIHSKYLEDLTSANYCDVLSKAIENNDFNLKLNKSKLSLMWQYKSMIKYKKCFGI
jgi:hypothetical protein